MFLNERNIITIRFFKKLNDKMLNSFINLNFIDFSYKLKLSKFMHVHDVFYSCHDARLKARPSRMRVMWLHASFATALADLISHVI